MLNKTFFTLFFILLVFNNVRADKADTLQRNIDSLQILLKKYDAAKKESGKFEYEKADTVKADLLYALFNNQLSYSSPSALEIIKQLITLSSAIGYKKGIANSLMGQSWILSNNHKYSEAVDLNKKALHYYTELHDSVNMRKTLYAIAANYQWPGNISEAAPYYTELLKMSEIAGDTNFIASSLMCLANIYGDLKDYDAALTYNDKAIELYYSMGDSLFYFFTLNYKFGYLIETQKYDEAENVLKILDKLILNIQDPFATQGYYSSKGQLKLRQLKYGEAIVNYKKAIDASSNTVDINLAIFFGDLGQSIYYATDEQLVYAGINPSQRNVLAKSYLLKAVQQGKENNMENLTIDTYNTLSILYENENNLVEALNYNKKYIILKDSLSGGDRAAGINGLKLKYETSKKEQEIILLKSQQENALLIAKQNRLINFGLVAALVAICIIAFIFYSQKQKTKFINASLKQAYSDLKNTQEQLIRSEKMAAFGTMASRVAHEIQNPLNFVNNFSDLSVELIDEIINGTDINEKTASAQLLTENLLKIKEHGKRAENIIKVLQNHSRAGTAHEFFNE